MALWKTETGRKIEALSKELTFGPADKGQIVGMVTCPTREVANVIADDLVDQQRAACVNVLPGITSVYRWKGKVCRDQEFLLIIKTDKGRAGEVLETLKTLHPYDEPELLFLPIESGSESYLRWMLPV